MQLTFFNISYSWFKRNNFSSAWEGFSANAHEICNFGHLLAYLELVIKHQMEILWTKIKTDFYGYLRRLIAIIKPNWPALIMARELSYNFSVVFVAKLK